MKKGMFSSLVLASLLFIGCGGGGDDDTPETTINVQDEIIISKIFPQYPKVPLEGRVKLTPVVTSKYTEEIKTSNTDDQIVVEWSSSDTSIATIDSQGVLTGRALGSTKITATATYSKDYVMGDGTEKTVIYSDTVTIPISIINTMGDISEISLSPTRATIDKNGGSKYFDITAVDNSGVLSALNQGVIDFNISNPQNNAEKILKQPSSISDGTNKILVESANDRIGYVFITPTYTDKDDGNITATGTPLVIQVSDIPSATPDNLDSSALNAGKYLDLEVDEIDGKKELHIVHYDSLNKELKYSYFNGSWRSENITPTQTGADNGMNAKIVLSPFDNNYKKPIISALEDSRVNLWYQNNSNNWRSVEVSDFDINNSVVGKTFKSGDKFLDIIADESNKLIHIAYFSPAQERIYVTSSTMDESTDLNFNSTLYYIDTNNAVQSLSLDLNRDNSLRIAYSTHQDGNISDSLNGVFYGSLSTSGFLVEKVNGTNGLEKNIVLKLDRQNRPSIIYSTPSNDIVYVQRTKEPNGYTWTSSNIAFNETITELNNMDFLFDHYNSPRIVFDSAGKIRYARRLPEKNNEWIVETPEEGSGTYGEYKAIDLDSENRVHIVYTSSDDKWFKYWAEPIFFDYRRYNLDSPIAGIDEVN